MAMTLVRPVLGSIAALGLAGALEAACGLTIQAAVEGSMNGAQRSELQGPVGSGSLLVEEVWPEGSILDLKASAYARAAQDDAGHAAVQLDGFPNGPTQPEDRLEAETIWSNTVTNNGGARVGYGYFSDNQATIPLGNFEPGESVTVTTTLLVESGDYPEVEGAQASIGDPLKLGSDPGVSGVVVETEPVAVEGTTWTAVKSSFRDR